MDAQSLLEQLANAGEARLRTKIAERLASTAIDIDSGIAANLARLSRLAAMDGDEDRMRRVADGARAHFANQRREVAEDLVEFIAETAFDVLGVVAVGAQAMGEEVKP